jgi:hypothetical protein
MLPVALRLHRNLLQLLWQYIAQKKKEPEALEKTPVPIMSPSFQELYEDD